MRNVEVFARNFLVCGLLFDLLNDFGLSLDHMFIFFLILDDGSELVAESFIHTFDLLLESLHSGNAFLELIGKHDFHPASVDLLTLDNLVDESQAVTQVTVRLSIALCDCQTQSFTHLLQI